MITVVVRRAKLFTRALKGWAIVYAFESPPSSISGAVASK